MRVFALLVAWVAASTHAAENATACDREALLDRANLSPAAARSIFRFGSAGPAPEPFWRSARGLDVSVAVADVEEVEVEFGGSTAAPWAALTFPRAVAGADAAAVAKRMDARDAYEAARKTFVPWLCPDRRKRDAAAATWTFREDESRRRRATWIVRGGESRRRRATWIVREDESRRRRGWNVDSPWRRVAATPRLERG